MIPGPTASRRRKNRGGHRTCSRFLSVLSQVPGYCCGPGRGLHLTWVPARRMTFLRVFGLAGWADERLRRVIAGERAPRCRSPPLAAAEGFDNGMLRFLRQNAIRWLLLLGVGEFLAADRFAVPGRLRPLLQRAAASRDLHGGHAAARLCLRRRSRARHDRAGPPPGAPARLVVRPPARQMVGFVVGALRPRHLLLRGAAVPYSAAAFSASRSRSASCSSRCSGSASCARSMPQRCGVVSWCSARRARAT